MVKFIEGEKVMILNGPHCGEFATVCDTTDNEFVAVVLNGKVEQYHSTALKKEDECVFTEDDLHTDSKNGGKRVDIQVDTSTRPIHAMDFCSDCNGKYLYSNLSIDGLCSSCDQKRGAEMLNNCQENDVDYLTKSILPDDSQERKTFPVYSGCVKYFPDALAAVSKRSYIGNNQHNPDKPLHWDRSKSGDELDALERHIIQGDWDCVAWRALAHLQKELEKGWRPKDWS